jgi:DNA-binding NarL/FixJ family response regulator
LRIIPQTFSGLAVKIGCDGFVTVEDNIVATHLYRILIVDDHPMMREGLGTLISRERDLIVCGEAETAGEALDAVTKLKPDLVLVDVTLPGPSGIELIKDICALQQDMLILVISMHDESLYAERVLRAGARGYIMKQESGPVMMQAIRRVLAKRIYLSDKMSALILENVVGKRTEASPIKRLSDREWEVFQLIGRGRSTVQIAEELHLSPKTVEAHRAHVKEKLDLKTMTELVSFASRWVETQDAR